MKCPLCYGLGRVRLPHPETMRAMEADCPRCVGIGCLPDSTALHAPQAAPAPTVDPIVEEVRADLLARSQVGIAKYGTTLAREDLSLADWLEHAYQETLDKALYLKRAKQKAEGMQDRIESIVSVCRPETDVSDGEARRMALRLAQGTEQ